MDPKQTIDLIECCYYTDVRASRLKPERLQEQQTDRKERLICILKSGYPAYVTLALQLDSCRLAGQKEIVVAILLAYKCVVS